MNWMRRKKIIRDWWGEVPIVRVARNFDRIIKHKIKLCWENYFPFVKKSQRFLDSSGTLNSQPATFHVQNETQPRRREGIIKFKLMILCVHQECNFMHIKKLQLQQRRAPNLAKIWPTIVVALRRGEKSWKTRQINKSKKWWKREKNFHWISKVSLWRPGGIKYVFFCVSYHLSTTPKDCLPIVAGSNASSNIGN